MIRRREAAYRYPAAQTTSEGPNGTTYPFRVFARAHTLAYWNNRDKQVGDILAGRAGGAQDRVLDPVLAALGAPVTIEWPKIDKGRLELGDGTVVDHTATSHAYSSEEKLFPIVSALTVGGTELPPGKGWVARTPRRARSAAGALSLVKPDSQIARDVLTQLTPGIRWGNVQNTHLVMAPETRADKRLDYRFVTPAEIASMQGETFTTRPMAMPLPIIDPGSGSVTLTVGIRDTVFTGSFTSKIQLTGGIVVDDLVDALVALAGFDRKGALETLSGVLGFDAKNPPATVPVEANLAVTPE